MGGRDGSDVMVGNTHMRAFKDFSKNVLWFMFWVCGVPAFRGGRLGQPAAVFAGGEGGGVRGRRRSQEPAFAGAGVRGRREPAFARVSRKERAVLAASDAPTAAAIRSARSSVLAFSAIAPLAQLAEQRTLNPRVRGSSPWRRTRPDLGFSRPGSSFFDLAWGRAEAIMGPQAVRNACATGRALPRRSIPAYERDDNRRPARARRSGWSVRLASSCLGQRRVALSGTKCGYLRMLVISGGCGGDGADGRFAVPDAPATASPARAGRARYACPPGGESAGPGVSGCRGPGSRS